MATIVKYKNQSGVTYAYKQESHYDPQTKQSRPKRTCIGRVDPVTGEIIPSAGRKKKTDMVLQGVNTDYKELYDQSLRELSSLRERFSELQKQNDDYAKLLASMRNQIGKVLGK